MSKSYVVLHLYDAFIKGEPVTVEKCCEAYDISIPTFRRYIALLRDYFMEEYNYESCTVRPETPTTCVKTKLPTDLS